MLGPWLGGNYGPQRTGATRISRRECIGFLDQTTTWTLSALSPGGFAINPGLADTFPWLSQVAPNYEQYCFHWLRFIYKSTCSDSTTATTNNNLGVVIFQLHYDPVDTAPSSRLEQLNYYGTRRTRPCDDLVLDVNVKSLVAPLLFVRDGALPANTDRRLYDLGKLYIATDGAQNTNQCGELWCEYDISFFKPKLYDSLGFSILSGKWTTTGVAATAWFGTAQTQLADSIGITFPAGGDTMVIPAQAARWWFLVLQFQNDAFANIAPTLTLSTTATIVDGPTVTNPHTDSLAAQTRMGLIIRFSNTPGVACTVGLTTGTGAIGANATGRIWLTMIDDVGNA